MSMESKASMKALRIFCAMLMLSLGFAHKPVQAAAAPSAAYDEAYRMPDGSFTEICAGHLEEQAANHTEKRHSDYADLFCEACLLSSSILVPIPDDSSWLKLSGNWIENRINIENQLIVLFSSSRPKARSPPAFRL